MVSGIVAVVVAFLGLAWTSDSKSVMPLFLILVAVPALGTRVWRYAIERRGRERDHAKRVAWQAFWVLSAWQGVALVLGGFFSFAAFSAMGPVPHSHGVAAVVALIVIPGLGALVIWFTWVRSRRMVDLLFPLPGRPPNRSEPPYLQLKL